MEPPHDVVDDGPHRGPAIGQPAGPGRTCPHREADSFSLDEAAPTDPRQIEREGFDAVTIYIDAEMWIQTGTELKRSNGDLVGSYYFRDLELNPTFTADEFTLEGLKKAP